MGIYGPFVWRVQTLDRESSLGLPAESRAQSPWCTERHTGWPPPRRIGRERPVGVEGYWRALGPFRLIKPDLQVLKWPMAWRRTVARPCRIQSREGTSAVQRPSGARPSPPAGHIVDVWPTNAMTPSWRTDLGLEPIGERVRRLREHHRTAGCGPARPVVWVGRANLAPHPTGEYAERVRLSSRQSGGA
jgi:hypothetical protein